MKKLITFIGLVLMVGASAQAKVITLKVASESTAEFSLPFTFGTHHGSSSHVTGTVKLDEQKLSLVSAEIRVPIESLKTGDVERDCHMMESLGLNYGESNFPEKHTCSNDNQVAKEGPDSIAFPDIIFTVESRNLSLGKNDLSGIWSIHGVSKTAVTSFQLKKGEDGKYIVDGSGVFSLNDYGIVVKPFFVVKVKDQAVAKFHVILQP